MIETSFRINIQLVDYYGGRPDDFIVVHDISRTVIIKMSDNANAIKSIDFTITSQGRVFKTKQNDIICVWDIYIYISTVCI